MTYSWAHEEKEYTAKELAILLLTINYISRFSKLVDLVKKHYSEDIQFWSEVNNALGEHKIPDRYLNAQTT